MRQEPVRVERRPVVVGAFRIDKDGVMDFTRLMEQLGNLLDAILCHIYGPFSVRFREFWCRAGRFAWSLRTRLILQRWPNLNISDMNLDGSTAIGPKDPRSRCSVFTVDSAGSRLFDQRNGEASVGAPKNGLVCQRG